MSAAAQIREALLSGRPITAGDVSREFNVHPSNLKNIITGMQKDGHFFRTRRIKGGFMEYTLEPEDGSPVHQNGNHLATRQPEDIPATMRRTVPIDMDYVRPKQHRPKTPQPGDVLLVQGLFLDDDGEIEVQCKGSDGHYVARIIAYRK